MAVDYNRAKIWQIGLFALNNTATNIALSLMTYYMFFTQNVLGLSAVVVGIIATSMRLWDAVTDPIVGFLLDKTDGKFGKFRPFMVLGNLIICASLAAMFYCPVTLSVMGKYIYTTLVYVVYILGYTFQTACTKGAQAALTNDPKQRPIFSMFDGAYNTVMFAGSALVLTTILAPRYPLRLNDPQMWKDASLLFIAASLICTALAVIGVWQKDRTEFFGLGNRGEKVQFKDYLPIIQKNRPLQMLVLAAATDKLAGMTTRGVLIYLYSNLLLNSSLQGQYSTVTMIPAILLSTLGLGWSRKVGLKKAFVVSTWASMALLTVMFFVQPDPTLPWLFLGLLFFQNAMANIATSIAIPMIADCADYETYSTGKFVPGMMGTLFSFVDKLFSSLSSTIIGFVLASVGFGDVQIPTNTDMGSRFHMAIMICLCIIPILGHIVSVIAMKFYPLTKEKMAEIQEAIAQKKIA